MTEKYLDIDKKSMQRSFDQAVASYDEAAVLQREVADRLLQRLDYIRIQPQRILNIGSGTGYCTQQLLKRFPKADVYALDISHAMLRYSQQQQSLWQRFTSRVKYINADAGALPFMAAQFDMVFSSLTLQWCISLDQVFAEIKRVLRANGMLLFSTFGPDTLKELRTSWQQVDEYTHVNPFIDMHDIGDAMLRAGLAEPVTDAEYITMTYAKLIGLLRDLKALGAHNVNQLRRHSLTGKGRLQALIDRYEAFRIDGRLPASYEVISGHAWIGQTAAHNTAPDEIHIPFSDIIK